ncbi:MAG TPA: hypothetical protein VE404_08060 [Verrucomicrobiae bacterium]|nr:hypothetical protein [Verrucomicrobiae bacterium]
MRRFIGACAIAAAAATAGCGFWVERSPGNIETRYESAWARVEKIERLPVEERGQAHAVHVWVYDAGEDRLITASVPLWLVRKVAKHSLDEDLSVGDAPLQPKVKIEDLLGRGPGLVVQAESDRDRVLVWLD